MDSKSKIFFKGSKTYFTSSLFFPKSVKNDVYTLYAFVRIVDDFVDQVPQNKNCFYEFKNLYQQALNGKTVNHSIITDFIKLAKKRDFEKKWIDAFFASMEADLNKSKYRTLEETLKYIYGSAEVIGLMMCQIMSLPKESHISASRLGRAMQYINFIRDIAEDNSFGRQYIPQEYLNQYGLNTLNYSEIKTKYQPFCNLIHQEIIRYQAWQKEAESGFKFIPFRLRVPIKTASDMYFWTSQQIMNNPKIIYKKQVKPNRCYIIFSIMMNFLAYEKFNKK